MPRPFETIERAAIRASDGTVYDVPRPGRHHDVIRLMHERARALGRTMPVTEVTPRNQGFVTSTGAFVSRRHAAMLAIRSGQITRTKWGGDLYSEDLW